MKEIRAVLLQKEQQLERLQKEIEALRLSIQLLEGEDPAIQEARGPSIVPPKDVPPKEKETGPAVNSVLSKQFP